MEDPHECCGCVCGCYNHAAAKQIKKLELQRTDAKKIEAKEKVTANKVADEKKHRAEAHIQDVKSSSDLRIEKAEAAKKVAEAKA